MLPRFDVKSWPSAMIASPNVLQRQVRSESPCGRPEVGRLGGSARARSRRGGPAGHVAHCPGPHMDSACETRARATTPTVLLRPTGAAWPRLRGCAEHARRPPVGLDEPGRMTPGRIRVIRKHRGSPGKETKRRSQCERQQRRPAAPQTGPATAPRPAPPAAPPALPVAEGHGVAGRPDSTGLAAPRQPGGLSRSGAKGHLDGPRRGAFPRRIEALRGRGAAATISAQWRRTGPGSRALELRLPGPGTSRPTRWTRRRGFSAADSESIRLTRSRASRRAAGRACC